MRFFETLSLVAALSIATAALAHQGVKNAGVMARMDGMLSAQKATKVLIDMAAGKRSFDADDADAAKARILEDLSRVPALFESPHDDPMTEARPIIWTQYDDFLRRNDQAVLAMKAVKTETKAGLQATLPAAGAACLDCHQTYRLKHEK